MEKKFLLLHNQILISALVDAYLGLLSAGVIFSMVSTTSVWDNSSQNCWRLIGVWNAPWKYICRGVALRARNCRGPTGLDQVQALRDCTGNSPFVGSWLFRLLQRAVIQPLHQSRVSCEIRSGCSGSYLLGSWKPQRMEAAQDVWPKWAF